MPNYLNNLRQVFIHNKYLRINKNISHLFGSKMLTQCDFHDKGRGSFIRMEADSGYEKISSKLDFSHCLN